MTNDPDRPAPGALEAQFAQALARVSARDMDGAYALLSQTAQAGHPRAQIELARMQLYGVGCAADPASAVHWLLRAEALGEPAAGYYLALVAVGHRALPRDGEMDRRVLAGIQRGHVPSLLAAAIHFGRKPAPADQALCVDLLGRAALGGDDVAAALLAERLARGEGVAVDAARAAQLRTRLQARGRPSLPEIVATAPQQPPGPARSLDLRDALFSPTVDIRAERPRVGVIDGLLSADECRLLVARAAPGLRASQTVDPDTGLPVQLPLRTSSDVNFDPIQEDLALRLVQLRIAAATGKGERIRNQSFVSGIS